MRACFHAPQQISFIFSCHLHLHKCTCTCHCYLNKNKCVSNVMDTIFLAEPFDSHAIELTSFLWHMPADTTETVAEHSTRLHSSINFACPSYTLYIQLLWLHSHWVGPQLLLFFGYMSIGSLMWVIYMKSLSKHSKVQFLCYEYQ